MSGRITDLEVHQQTTRSFTVQLAAVYGKVTTVEPLLIHI
jgi:hypothetical protein